MVRRLTVLAVLFLGALAGCSSDSSDGPAIRETSVEKLYNDAVDALQAGRNVQAQKLFEEVERQHPYSAWATRAQLQAAYAAYARNAYDDAANALDRFIQLNPGNRDIAYAYYMRALALYEQIVDVGRDQRKTELALAALDEVIRRFPDTEYARDSRGKVDLARDQLGGKEMEIGRYYMGQRQYVAAINRFRRVVELYQTTSHVEEALHRLVECYLALGVKEEAQTAAAVLGYNYPGGRWYQDSFALLRGEALEPDLSSQSWMTRMWRKVF